MSLTPNYQEFEPLPLILPGSLEYLLASDEIGFFPGAMDYVHRTGNECAFISRPGNGGLLEAVSLKEFEEFMNDGEMDARQDELEAQWDLEDELFAEELILVQ